MYIGANVEIEWWDNKERENSYISLMQYDQEHNVDTAGVPDDNIVFYADSVEHLENMRFKGYAPFRLVSYELVEKDDSSNV